MHQGCPSSQIEKISFKTISTIPTRDTSLKIISKNKNIKSIKNSKNPKMTEINWEYLETQIETKSIKNILQSPNRKKIHYDHCLNPK